MVVFLESEEKRWRGLMELSVSEIFNLEKIKIDLSIGTPS